MPSDKKNRKGRIAKLFGIMVILAGLLAALYPAVSNYVFENRADSLVVTYEDAARTLEDHERDELIALANEYNETLLGNKVRFTDPFGEVFGLTKMDEAVREFADRLSLDGSGVIGSVWIPVIDTKLPIFANDDYDQALERGTVLVDGTSIPVGGAGTHAVISGHTGLNTASIFTDLISVKEGDEFYVSILGDTLAYKVDRISVVDPYDYSELLIDPENDYCTLLTCTPYGVNSHRLLVRGIRTEYVPEAAEAAEDMREDITSQWSNEYLKAAAVGCAIILVSGCGVFLGKVLIKNAKKK